eukprot:g19015.t1
MMTDEFRVPLVAKGWCKRNVLHWVCPSFWARLSHSKKSHLHVTTFRMCSIFEYFWLVPLAKFFVSAFPNRSGRLNYPLSIFHLFLQIFLRLLSPILLKGNPRERFTESLS